jgi:chemotaxis methyl-accepting protein methylase
MQVDEHLSDRHFRSLAELISTQVGIQLPEVKRTMVEGRLRRRVRALGLPDLAAYGRHLFENGGLDAEMTCLIDCVTTNKTDFFREPAHFEFLRDKAIPALVDGRRGPARLKLWSAACSIGAEAYTMAMVLHDIAARRPSLDFAILGTDISTDVLHQAEKAIYPAEMVEPVPVTFRERYLMQARNPRRQEVRIVPELRRRASFRRLNLMDASYPFDRDVDVIFCRNVLIYFDKPTQRAVLGRLAGHLRPGGYLVVGHSESMSGAGDLGLKQVLPTVFTA